MVTWATNQPTTPGIEVSTSALVLPRVRPSMEIVTTEPGWQPIPLIPVRSPGLRSVFVPSGSALSGRSDRRTIEAAAVAPPPPTGAATTPTPSTPGRRRPRARGRTWDDAATGRRDQLQQPPVLVTQLLHRLKARRRAEAASMRSSTRAY